MRNFRNAFWLTLIVNFILAAALGYGWWRWHPRSGSGSNAAPAAASAMRMQTPASNAPPQPALVPLELTPQRMQSIGVKTGSVEYRVVHDEIRVTGNVAVDERLQAYVQTRFSGWIQTVFASANFQYVRKGEPLFTIYSPDLVTTEREYLLSKQNQEHLAASPVSGVAAGANSLAAASLERLEQWNLPAREIAALETSGKVEQNLEIDSPVSGFVVERNALPNQYVQPGTNLYTVADLSTVWVFAQVFQNDLGRVKAGDPANLTVDSYPGRTFHGRVDFMYPDVDMTTRTARVRLIFSNAGLTLKPGMFVSVMLEIPMGRQLVIPASAVFQSGTRQIAFVNHGQGYLEPREIVTGPQVGGEYTVTSGLKAGEQIVTSANFLIDSESQLQAALGSFAPPPPGAGAAAAMNMPQNSVEFSTVPSPPVKGSDAFQVKLSDSHGAGISGAQVQVTFLTPPMPEMAMPAQRAGFTLVEKGNGIYQAQGKLPAGGLWQVSVVARKNGTVVASKQLTLDVGGGM
ncbi:MAG TPA: efflux RND transporter periplasmic adaptor subunit [Candidatus Acidoferrales bacterium]|nr:efflux RND transporter periplasmic adaptor subunit [Candidatus Acidoferrales bacterium]